MPYENIPHTGVGYTDAGLGVLPITTQPRILILGSATSGLTYEMFNVTDVRAAEVEFGSTSDLMRGVHETQPSGADNVAVMRIGGRQGNLVLTDSAAGTITITPEFRDDTILTRYALAMEVNAGVQRTAIFDLTDETWVFDNDEILVINEGVIHVEET